jgi:hypothetical protein
MIAHHAPIYMDEAIAAEDAYGKVWSGEHHHYWWEFP